MQIDAARIRREREKRAWSQEQLAQVTGLGLRTVQRIESSGIASSESAAALASVLALSIEELSMPASLNTRQKTTIAIGVSGLIAIIAAFTFSSFFVQDALRLDFVYENNSPDNVSKVESQLLLHLNETAAIDLQGQPKFTFRAEEYDNSIELDVAIHEYSKNNQTVLIGRGKTTTQIGKPARFYWKKTGKPNHHLRVIPTRSNLQDRRR